MGRRGRSDWDRTAPTVPAYAGFKVGQAVLVSRNTKTERVSFSGTVTRICIPVVGWKFAVVQDDHGGSYACDFDELM